MLPMTFPDIGQRTGLVLMKIVGLRSDLSTKIDVIVTGLVLEDCWSRTRLVYGSQTGNCLLAILGFRL